MARRLSKADLLARYRTRIKMSQKWRRDEGYDDLWARMIDLYAGKHFKTASAEDQISINIAFSTLNVIFPSVTINFPKITCAAMRPEQEDEASITEAVSNWQWRHFQFQPEFRLASKDFLAVGHGWVKNGWKFVETPKPYTDEQYTEAFVKARDEADQYAVDNPSLAGQLPTDDEIRDSLGETQLIVAEDQPTVERVDFFDVFVDPDGQSMKTIRWIAQRIRRPIEDVRGDDRYQRQVRMAAKADSQSKHIPDGRNAEKCGDDVQRVTVWEFWDIAQGTMCAFTEGGDGFLIEPRKSPFPFGHPFEMLRNYDVPNCFYPMGELEALECLQLELNSTRSQMMNHRKRYARKYVARERSLTPSAVAALESANDGEIVFVGGSEPLDQTIAAVQITPTPPEFYQQSDQIEGDMDTVSGVNEYARGGGGDIRRTATEASIIQDAANSRAADKLAVIELSISRVASKVISLTKIFMTGEQVARVVGPNNASLWVPYNRDWLVADADFEVEAGSTMPVNETQRRNDAMQLMGVVSPLFGIVVDPLPTIEYVLRNGFGIKNPQRFLMAAPPMGLGDPSQQDPSQGTGGPPGGAPPGVDIQAGAAAPPPSNTGAPADPQGGTDAVPPEILAQLAGQTGYAPNTLQ